MEPLMVLCGSLYALMAYAVMCDECDHASLCEAALLGLLWPAVGFVRLCFRAGFRIGQEIGTHVMPVIDCAAEVSDGWQ